MEKELAGSVVISDDYPIFVSTEHSPCTLHTIHTANNSQKFRDANITCSDQANQQNKAVHPDPMICQ